MLTLYSTFTSRDNKTSKYLKVLNVQKIALKYSYSNFFYAKRGFSLPFYTSYFWVNSGSGTFCQELYLFKAILFFMLSFCTHCFPVKIEFLKVHSIFMITVILNLSHYLCVHANSAIKGHIFVQWWNQCFIWDAIHHVCCVCYILWAEFVVCLLFSQTLPVYSGFSPLAEN